MGLNCTPWSRGSARPVWALYTLAMALRGAEAGCSGTVPDSEWIDPDTPQAACKTSDRTGAEMELVFSDEFEAAGRTFRDGDDPKWTAITGFPDGNLQVNAYDDSPAFANTVDGKLRLIVDNRESKIEYTDWSTGEYRSTATRHYASPMLQTWNKFCYAEGVIELSARLPGNPLQPGIWPAWWLMGNLGRATAKRSTDGTWPFSYDHCPTDEQKAVNQYNFGQQKINACLGPNFTEQYGLNPYQGRGATEIDIIEAMPGYDTFDYKRDKVNYGHCAALSTDQEYEQVSTQKPFVATSLQLAPGLHHGADQRPADRDAGAAVNCLPTNWDQQWYKELHPGNLLGETYGNHYNSTINVGFWGDHFKSSTLDLQTDSMSALNELPHSAYQQQHIYRLEWYSGNDGFVRFTMDGKLQYQVNASTVTRSNKVSKDGEDLGELLGRMIPLEPSYIMLNIDMSPKWGWVPCESGCDCCEDCSNPACTTCMKNGVNVRKWMADLCNDLPAQYDVDWIRVYQRKGTRNHGCSTKAFPSEGWIESHKADFVVPNRDEPLRPVFAGGARCTGDSQCGQPFGSCTDGVCVCEAGRTGPSCLVPQAGASKQCRRLEDAVIGGGACTSDADCGVFNAHGTCRTVQISWEAPAQFLKLADGSFESKGGGSGRCRCSSGRGGPHCHKQLSGDTMKPRCVPDPARTGADLDSLIAMLCGQDRAFAKLEEVARACQAVLWKPHWKTGGEFSQCGAYMRASWVVAAVFASTNVCCTSAATCDLPQLFAAGLYGHEPSLPSCFVNGDYGAKADGACDYTNIAAVYAPQVSLDEWSQYSWMSGVVTKAANITSAAECNLYCSLATTTVAKSCEVFTYDEPNQACWLKENLTCSWKEGFTASASHVSGVVKSCLAWKGGCSSFADSASASCSLVATPAKSVAPPCSWSWCSGPTYPEYMIADSSTVTSQIPISQAHAPWAVVSPTSMLLLYLLLGLQGAAPTPRQRA